MGDIAGIPISKLLQLLPILLTGTGVIKNPNMAALAGVAGGVLPGMLDKMNKPQSPQIPYFGNTQPNLSSMGGGQGLQMGGGQGMGGQGFFPPELLQLLIGGRR